MNDGPAPGAAKPVGTSAGQLLREARLANGLHIAALASAIKVTPRKLELLEADRFDELPDATFARALAQTVCRTLKIDPVPVLALLPPSRSHRLEKAGPGLNTRLRERPAALQPGDRGGLSRLAIWGPALIVLAAAVVYFMPAGWLPTLSDRGDSPASPEGAASSPVAVFPPSVATPEVGAPVDNRAPSDLVSAPGSGPSLAGASPSMAAAGAAAESATPAASSSAVTSAVPLLRLRAEADSWVGVTDAAGRTLFGRTLRAGEAVELDGTPPLRVRVGNAAATSLVFRGEAVALGRHARGNLATVELK